MSGDEAVAEVGDKESMVMSSGAKDGGGTCSMNSWSFS